MERAISRRFAQETVTSQILPKYYISALPGRSAADLLLLFTDTIEQAFSQNQCVSTATFDIKGAFDAVLLNRLIQCLLDQNWPPHLVRWVSSFLLGRKAAVSLDSNLGPFQAVTRSLPQGLLASLILFLLFMEPLFFG